MFAIAATVMLTGCSRPVSSQERALFVTGRDLQRVNCDIGRGNAGRFSKEHVPFMYDSIDFNLNATDETASCKVLISATVTAARDADTAAGLYNGGAGGAKIGLKVSDIEFAEAKSPFRYGDQSQYFDLTKNGHVVGYYFQARMGRVVYQYLVFGLRFGKAETFAGLFEPKLKQARRFYRKRS